MLFLLWRLILRIFVLNSVIAGQFPFPSFQNLSQLDQSEYFFNKLFPKTFRDLLNDKFKSFHSPLMNGNHCDSNELQEPEIL